ncbi:MAG: lysine N6-hydroxylase [Cryptosporangiaceae bacterium]|nr:lysine N6-hydroxylase [Cryptosporangiaceae bacterium]MDQ1652505.1 lysine N6-hydroxylase [Cryptosporangiaceae bacterium]MDQ1655616.1 lysine N6-hydroxylase [Cryptosporangiaceae bacterium]
MNRLHPALLVPPPLDDDEPDEYDAPQPERTPVRILDVAGVGIGPFNLSLAALAAGHPDLQIALFDERPRFSWHPGTIPAAALQTGFLADLVTLVAPASPWSFLSYLCAHDRMYPFYLSGRSRLRPREYEDYCRWAAEGLPSCHFGARVDTVSWDNSRRCFAIRVARTADAVHSAGNDLFGDGVRAIVYARHVVLGTGSAPQVPFALPPAAGAEVFHSAEYAQRAPRLGGRRHITVVGSGQSGAEVFLDLLRRQDREDWALSWLTRSPGFAPLESSALAAEQLTPEFLRYVHGLAEPARQAVLAAGWRLHRAVDPVTLDAIFAELYEHLVDGCRPPVVLRPGFAVESMFPSTGGVTLSGRHTADGTPMRIETDAVVLATGYSSRRPACLAPLEGQIRWDPRGPGLDFRLAVDPPVTGGLFVQNSGQHSQGAAGSSLALGAYRAAAILNQVAGRELYPLPKRTAFTTFGPG